MGGNVHFSKCPTVGEWLSKCWAIHKVDCCIAIDKFFSEEILLKY